MKTGVVVGLLLLAGRAFAGDIAIGLQPGTMFQLPVPGHFTDPAFDIAAKSDDVVCTIVQGAHKVKSGNDSTSRVCKVKMTPADKFVPGPATLEVTSGGVSSSVAIELVPHGNLYTQTAGSAGGVPYITSELTDTAGLKDGTIWFLLHTQDPDAGAGHPTYPFLGRISVKLQPKIDELVTVDQKWLDYLAAQPSWIESMETEGKALLSGKKLHVTGTWDPAKNGGAKIHVAVPGFENRGGSAMFRQLDFVQKGGFRMKCEDGWYEGCKP